MLGRKRARERERDDDEKNERVPTRGSFPFFIALTESSYWPRVGIED